ncbi:aspartate/glutamate racemase family protein [Pantoea dispersa]|uniref:aspartate/glutamate racemase family protein n=1 Tax=Pantoea dispersa TaxID=59814 RepID=UPI00092E9F2C|nr:aspartate/glutamate racemase family protein [Pantoea dispersa]
MKTIGILGGMSAASTQIYYRKMCDLVRQHSGGLHSPELLIRSLNFANIENLQANGLWEEAGSILNTEAKSLERGGADFIVLATNTMHKLADQIMKDVNIPLIHIADATAERIVSAGLKNPGLMATAFTMEQPFYLERLNNHFLRPIVPAESDRKEIHRIIYDELCKDIITPDSRIRFEDIAKRLIDNGADCIILGCTEVCMLLNQDNVTVPVFDTTLIHCEKAINVALSS